METTPKRFGFEQFGIHGLCFFLVLIPGFSHAMNNATTSMVPKTTAAVTTHNMVPRTSKTVTTSTHSPNKSNANHMTSGTRISTIVGILSNESKTSSASSSLTTTSTTATTGLSTNINHANHSSESAVSAISTSHSATLNASSDSSFVVSSDSSTSSPMQTTSSQNTNIYPIIIGVVVGVGGALIIAVVVIIIVCCWRRKGQLEATVIQRSQMSTLSSRKRQLPIQARPIKVSDFLEHVNHHQGKISAYKMEFGSLPSGNRVGKSVSKATQQQHSHLNRYINILPYNDTLVPLYKSEEQQGYINASFVDGYKKTKAYIASQAPVSQSLGHFWQMIWEHECGKIIMVANLFECGRAKCDKYWPNVNDTVTYGDIRIEGIEEEPFGDYILRTFRIGKDLQMMSKEKPRSRKTARKSTLSVGDNQNEMVERRLVYQFHFTTWPDQGVPNTCSALLKLYRHALKEPLKDCKDGPVVVHCSAGVGRTGTLIALDVSLEQAKDIGVVDIPKCIDTMRRQRMFMVQTVEQYIFIHHALLEAMMLDKVEMTLSQFEPIYKQLSEPGFPDGLSRLQREMKVLDVLKPRFNQFSVAERNREKNRSSKFLPADMFLPYIKSDDGQSDIYVNAVHVSGFTKTTGADDDDDNEERIQYGYIATQSPMRETIEDFWTMIKETGSSTIVMLNELEGAERYWPEDGRTFEYGSFSITNMGEISSEDIRMTDLQITVRKKLEVIKMDTMKTSSTEYSNAGFRKSTRYDTDTFNIRHFRLLWPDAMPKESTLISLYAEVVRCQERNPNRPVVVHCLYGVDRCGVFCGVMNVLDSIKHKREVDVFNAVKSIRRTRPEFIEELSQYKFLYDVAFEWVRTME